MNTVTAPADSIAQTDARALRTLGSIVFVTLLGDQLFWRAEPGISLGLFVLVLGLLLAVSRSGSARKMWLPGSLLIASCAQTAIETSLSNFIVLSVLLVALMSAAFFHALPATESRFIESALSLLKAPARWFPFGKAVLDSPLAASTSTIVAGDNVARGLRIVIPGLLLCTVFAFVLSSGNAMLGHLFTRFADQLIHWLLHFDFSPARFTLWAVFATLALGLLWPGVVRNLTRSWTLSLPRWQRPHRREALWQSGFALIALNALFFTANTIDAIYLWKSATLPPDVNPSAYLHAGVWSLILAVVLSAVVLAGMFQQQEDVSRTRVLKGLGLFWGIQNLALIAGVLLRLKLYVEVWQLTEKRVYVGFFLLLVTCGFLSLAWSIMHGRGLHWLISRNLIATFALFFALQFPDVTGAVARYNVVRWEREPRRGLDLDYLVSLGPNALPSLVRVAKNSREPWIAAQARDRANSIAVVEAELLKERDWRSWQMRREAGIAAVLTHAAR